MKRWALFLVPATMLLVAPGVSESSGFTIVAWGWNDQGQCDVPSPNTDFVAVSGGYGHSLCIRTGSR
jgi:hypothetical protein